MDRKKRNAVIIVSVCLIVLIVAITQLPNWAGRVPLIIVAVWFSIWLARQLSSRA